MALLFYIGLLILLIIMGIPVAFSLGITSLVLLLVNNSYFSLTFSQTSQMMFSGINNFVMLSVPLFLFAGKLMNASGITKRIFRFADSLVGFLPGGLAHVNVVASIIFSGMSGAAISDATGLGQIEIHAMREQGYDPAFSGAVTGASATIGPIIPPSIPMVIYGVVAGTSIGSLFIGGIIPGFIMGFSMMGFIAYYAWKKDLPRSSKIDYKKVIVSFSQAFLALLTPVIIIFGIYLGIFTPTEAAGMAALYALFISIIVYKKINLSTLKNILFETVKDTATIGIIVSAACLYGNLLIRTRIPMLLAQKVSEITNNPIIILLILNLLFLFVGTFLETTAAITLLVPIIKPLLIIANIDLIHFGVVLIINLMIGVLTPPFGLTLFALSRIGNIPLIDLVKALKPFYMILIFVLLLITFVPSLVTFLPNTLIK